MGSPTMGSPTIAAVQEALEEERAIVAAAEAEVVTWFRQWHSLLSRRLNTLLAGLDAASSVARAESLLDEFPRGIEEYAERIRAHVDLPLHAFTEGQGLEMVCYMALQALPRHSRVYANVHLQGGWHDSSELRAVQQAVLKYERALVEAKRRLREGANGQGFAAGGEHRLAQLGTTGP